MDNNVSVSIGNKKKKSIFDGLFSKNTILVSALVLSPVITAATTVRSSIEMIVIFSMLTFFTLLFASFIPRNMVYAVRIILYTVISALVYVPVVMTADFLFPGRIAKLGIFVPLFIVNSLIVSEAEIRFFRIKRSKMYFDILAYIIGFDFVLLVFTFIRELLSTGSIGDRIFGLPITFPALALPFGGFILLGLLASLFRILKSSVGRRE